MSLTLPQIDYLRGRYLAYNEDRGELLVVFPELIEFLYNFNKPMRLIDLSWMMCIYGPPFSYAEDHGMFNKDFDVSLVNTRAQFNWQERRFETALRFFAPNV